MAFHQGVNINLRHLYWPLKAISSEGQVKFSSLNFGYGMEKYEKGRSKEFNIGKPVAEKILNAVGEYFSNEYLEIFATDIGDWKMEIINTDGESYHFRFPCADFEIDGIDLSDQFVMK